MTNVKFSRKEIEKEIKLNSEKIEKISLFGTPLESITPEEVEIEVFPNRPDLIPLRGFIRGFKSFLGKKTGLKEYKITKSEKKYKVLVDKSVKDIRPYTVCAIVKNLSFNNEKIIEIMDMQEKLHTTLGRNRDKVAIGIYPLDKIKFPITYSAKNPGTIKFQPLEGQKVLSGSQILSKTPAGKKYSWILKGKKKYPVFTDSDNKILSMPPIINSEDIGRVTEKTKEVFVECSGTEQQALNKTLNIIVTTLAEMGGKIHSVQINDEKKIITPDLTNTKMPVSLENVNKLLGLNLKENDLKPLLERMGYKYRNKSAIVPAWRVDILHEVDIIEDIAIAYGYHNLVPEIPNISTIGEETKTSKMKRKITSLLIGLGLLEISSYHLIKSEEAERMKLKRILELENSKTEYKILRPNLLIPSLRILAENIDTEYPQKLFEIGRVFLPDQEKETGVKEKDNLIMALAPSNFTEAKQHLDYLMSNLGLEYDLEETNINGFIEGRTGSIMIKDKKIGHIGEIHPKTLNDWKIKMPLSIVEVSLDKIYKALD